MSADTTNVFIIDGKSGAILADANDEIVGKNTDEGKESMTSVTESMGALREGMEQLGMSISNVGDAATKINEILNLIHDVTALIHTTVDKSNFCK